MTEHGLGQPLRWKARQWSDFGQLYDVRTRWWSPQLGVFTSIDELSFYDLRTTLWGWGGQNPITWTDPTGRFVPAGAVVLAVPASLGLGASVGLGVVGGSVIFAEVGLELYGI